MTLPIFIDTNVPIYAAGRPHPLKEPCAGIIALVAQQPMMFITNAEVLQELLHRYLSLRFWAESGQRVFREFASLMMGRIEAVYVEDVEYAATLADRHPRLLTPAWASKGTRGMVYRPA